MRPYLAVLKDSFREARASRVLWFGLLLILLFLAALCPLSLRPEVATELQLSEFADPDGLLEVMRADAEVDEPSPGRHLWNLFGDDERTRFNTALDGNENESRDRGPRSGRRRHREIQEGVNGLLSRDDFYDVDAWANVPLDDELAALAVRDDLDDVALASRNRKIMEATWPQYIETQTDNVYYLNYFGNQIDVPLPLSEQQKAEAIDQILLAAVQILLGMIGTLVAVLVTASFVPKMFEPGEITLLLSKPVSRSLLFLTKFLGGCIFILLNAGLLLVGLWLIAGWRFGIWNNGLLWCIPVYVFVFAIFYSVSASAGAIWRNAILAICVTVAFWLFTFLLGVGKASVEQLAVNPNRVTDIVPAGENLLAVNESKETLLWNRDTGDWDEVFTAENRGGPPRFARRFAFAASSFVPKYDPANDRIVALEPVIGRFGSNGSSRVIVARQDEGWERYPAGQSPTPAQGLFVDTDGRVVLVTLNQIYEFIGQPDDTTKAQEWFSKNLGGLIPVRNNKSVSKLLPADPRWKRPFATDMDRETGDIAVMTEGRLVMLGAEDDGSYYIRVEKDLELEGGAILSLSGGRVLVATRNSDAIVFETQTLDEVGRYRPFGDIEPRQAVSSGDGRYIALLSHDQRLWIYDVPADEPSAVSILHNGDISAAAFDSEGRLLIADRTTRVTRLNTASGATDEEFSPAPDLVESIYRYGIKPAWTVLPKPSDLDNVITWLMTDETSISFDENFDRNNLQSARDQLDLKTPVWSNVAFLVLMLTATCIYINRRDF